jgi:dsDNA-specific endonuclease/ATPase MutS2
MKIGDKVRMIHDTIEGVVIKVLSDKQVEIEDTFGFNFPVLKKDLLIVNAVENQYFKRDNSELDKTSTTQTSNHKTYGYFQLAIVSESQNFGIYILNNTEIEGFVAVYGQTNSQYELLDSTILRPDSKQRVDLVPLSKLESWKSILVVQHNCGSSTSKPNTKEFSVGIKASKILQAQDEIQQLNTKGFVKALTHEEIAIDKEGIKNSLNSIKEPFSQINKLPKPNDEVDLHADALDIDLKLSNSEILRKQLAHFKHNLEAAIVNKMSSIIFIHGVGNGVLSDAIHKSLKEFEDVKYFEDAQKSKFGYGATKVVLK